MKMVLPVDGYRSASEFMQGLQGSQGDMFWLYKQQGHWHGGIHFFDSFAPGAVWQTGSQTGLKSMTDGHIVAWRLNDVYPTIKYKNAHLKYSSSFLLIKSTCTPDSNKPEHALDFYTLWMQIAPLEEYKEDGPPTATVTASSLNIREDNPQEGWERTGLTDTQQTLTEEEKKKYAAPVKKEGPLGLPRDSVVELIEEATFLLDGRPTPFAFVRIKSLPARARSGVTVDDNVWISADTRHLKRDEPWLPEWMKKARDKGEFNKVVLPGEAIPVKAGDIIGHLSCLDRPDESAHRFCHLEVFSQDSRFLDFLNNKAGITTGGALVQSEAGKKRYNFDESNNTFSVIAVGDDPSLTTAERFTAKGQVQIKEVEGKNWYFIPEERAWLAAEDVVVMNQYDLTKRGFIPLEQNEAPQSVTQTPMEGWLHKVFERLKQLAEENTADLYSSGYIQGYQKLLRQMDSNRDGVLSESEVWQFLHNRQPHILNQVHRFVVKHHSEWLRDGISELWRTALADQAEAHPELALYNKQFIDALVWMKDVPEIHSGEALWHMHPVVFLSSVKKDLKITKEMLRRIWKDSVRVPDETLAVIAEELTLGFIICNINTRDRLYHFMAQVFQEVGPSLNLNENFNYRSNVLVAKFLYYRNRRSEADEDGYIPGQRPAKSQNIANKVYSNRGGNGGYDSGDGWRFRGRGMKQLTFRGNYRSFTNYHEIKWNSRIDFESEPDLLSQTIYAVRSALYFWDFNKLYLKADNGTSREVADSITLIVNKYDDHYEDRFNNLTRFLSEGVFDEVF